MARGQLTSPVDFSDIGRHVVQVLSENYPKASGSGLRRMGIEVMGRVDEYLLRLDSALTRRKATPAQRRSISVDIRNRIYEKLAARSDAELPGLDGAHLKMADADAVLAELGPPEKHALTISQPSVQVQQYTGPRSVSLLAVAGGVWALLFLVMLGLWKVVPELPVGTAVPWWRSLLQATILPMGWAAWAAAPVLGLLAMDRIRESGGRLCGLSLAVFDVMFFPLLALDGILFWGCWALNQRMGDPGATDSAMSVFMTQVLPAAACVLGDYILITRVWAGVRRAGSVAK